MSCCARGINGCLDLRCLAFSLDGQVSAEWNGCPGSQWDGVLETVRLHCDETQQVGYSAGNSSKYINFYGPRVFGGPRGPLCELLQYMPGWTFELRCLRKTLKKGPYILHMLYRNFIRWNQGKFFILSGNLLLRESTFYIVNCLKSFGFKLFFVYTFKLLRGPFRHICTKILLYFDKHMSLSNVAEEWLINYLTKQCKN